MSHCATSIHIPSSLLPHLVYLVVHDQRDEAVVSRGPVGSEGGEQVAYRHVTQATLDVPSHLTRHSSEDKEGVKRCLYCVTFIHHGPLCLISKS